MGEATVTAKLDIKRYNYEGWSAPVMHPDIHTAYTKALAESMRLTKEAVLTNTLHEMFGDYIDQSKHEIEVDLNGES